MATNLSVRLDDNTERKLNELVDHFNARGPNTMPAGARLIGIKPSHVVRHAIEQLHDTEIAKKGATSR